MIRTLCIVPDEPLRENIPVKEFTGILKNPNALLWVDFDNEPDASAESILTGIFRFHPLAVDDALEETHTPKIDDWGDYLYIVLNAFLIEGNGALEAATRELDIFLGSNYVVTHHDTQLNAIEKAWDACHRDKRYITHGPDHLLYKIIDDLVAEYWPAMEKIDEEIDRIEDQVFHRPEPDTLERLFSLKRVLLSMRRIITPQREVLNKLARDDYEVVDPQDRVFFRDIYDHLVRLHDINESLRDLVGGALDTYLSVVNNRMNEVMKTLTIITTLFMPLTFVVGFFGMNFFAAEPPQLAWTADWVFYITMAAMFLVPMGMYLWMRRRTWV